MKAMTDKEKDKMVKLMLARLDKMSAAVDKMLLELAESPKKMSSEEIAAAATLFIRLGNLGGGHPPQKPFSS
jgi:hypothetical protein